MNKYKKSMNKISIRDNVKEEIILKTSKQKNKHILLPIAFASFILIIGVGIASASRYIYTSRDKARFSNGIFESVIEYAKIKTNFDDVFFKGKDTTIYENIPIKEAEELIGINLLSIDEDKEHLVTIIPYSTYTHENKGKITQLFIKYDPYILEESEMLSKQKSIALYTLIYTTNAALKDEDTDNSENDNSNIEFVGEFDLPNLNTKGFMLKYEYIKEDGWEDNKVGTITNSLKFSYDGVEYTLQGVNMSKDEVLEYAERLK